MPLRQAAGVAGVCLVVGRAGTLAQRRILALADACRLHRALPLVERCGGAVCGACRRGFGQWRQRLGVVGGRVRYVEILRLGTRFASGQQGSEQREYAPLRTACVVYALAVAGRRIASALRYAVDQSRLYGLLGREPAASASVLRHKPAEGLGVAPRPLGVERCNAFVGAVQQVGFDFQIEGIALDQYLDTVRDVFTRNEETDYDMTTANGTRLEVACAMIVAAEAV